MIKSLIPIQAPLASVTSAISVRPEPVEGQTFIPSTGLFEKFKTATSDMISKAVTPFASKALELSELLHRNDISAASAMIAGTLAATTPLAILATSDPEERTGNIARKYEQSAPVGDSLVRLDQEEAIANDLQNGIPVLIRGVWRMGKTSMVFSLGKHRLENLLYFDALTEEKITLEAFQIEFLYDAARFLLKRGSSEKGSTASNRATILKSGKTPLEYLNDHLAKHDEKVFVAIDELLFRADHPEILRYVASFKNLSQIQLAVVLHRFSKYEEIFKEIFGGFKTYFVRSLTLEEVGILINRPLTGTGITFTNGAVKEIYNFSGGRPMEVHNVCKALMDPASPFVNPKSIYNEGDIKTLIRLLKGPHGTYDDIFYSAIRNYRKVYEHSMSGAERTIIDRLVERDEIPISEIDANTVGPLIDTTFVVKDDEKEFYHLNGGLFRHAMKNMRPPVRDPSSIRSQLQREEN